MKNSMRNKKLYEKLRTNIARSFHFHRDIDLEDMCVDEIMEDIDKYMMLEGRRSRIICGVWGLVIGCWLTYLMTM